MHTKSKSTRDRFQHYNPETWVVWTTIIIICFRRINKTKTKTAGNRVQLTDSAGNLWQQLATIGNCRQECGTDRYGWKLNVATTGNNGQLQATVCNRQALLETCGNNWQQWATAGNCEQQQATASNSAQWILIWMYSPYKYCLWISTNNNHGGRGCLFILTHQWNWLWLTVLK